MTEKQFNEMKIKAEMYALMNVPNRIRLFALTAFEDGKYKKVKHWNWDTDNTDVKIIDGIAEFKSRFANEVDSTFDCFFISHYHCDLYSDHNNNPVTIPQLDLDINFYQLKVIKTIIVNAVRKAFNDEVRDWVGNDKSCLNDCLKTK
jgi:hypothetical protein